MKIGRFYRPILSAKNRPSVIGFIILYKFPYTVTVKNAHVALNRCDTHLAKVKGEYYTVNYKKGGSTFVIITLLNLDRFL